MGRGRGMFLSIGLFSIFVNLLMLTGPLFMLQVYDRVLGSRSEATLTALFVLVALLYGLMGVLDYARGRVAARVGAKFQAELDGRVFDALLRRGVAPAERARPATGLKDLESIQRFLGAPVLFAIFDMPWTPIFIFAIFIFHPLLGWLAVAGGVFLIFVTLMNQVLTSKPVKEAHAAAAFSDAFAEGAREQSELVQGLGMRPAVLDRWKQTRDRALASSVSSSDLTGTFTTITKTFRFFLQSAMLALGAYLVLQNELTPGAMIAGSILMGRALAPVEQAIGGWPMFQRARQGWASLKDLLTRTPAIPPVTQLPAPRAILEAYQVTVVPPGEQVATLRMLSFRLEEGTAMGVIGPSGSGKSTLARAITGIWPVASGKVRLDGATLDQYAPQDLGAAIGYLPQDVSLFAATIAENIARLQAQPDPAKVVEAAKKAGAHDLILGLPDGYDTRLNPGGNR
ncbi:MAG: type I secretion system permease/ATPase, partial [Pseudomonadota bacterium]